MGSNKLTKRDIALRQWLAALRLEHYAESFEQHDVRLDVLAELSDADLKELGVTLGDRKRLLKAIVELQTTAQQPPSTSTATAQAVAREAERRQLTVLFCDLADSTKLSQQLDPEDLRALMQAYQSVCRDIIARYDGHIAQYLGDGLVVYFGWPRAHEDDAVRAIRAALELVDAVSRLGGVTALRARAGIHTGLVVVGETGDGDASIPKAAVGDTPNIAARLQALAEPGAVVVSEGTHSLARGVFDYADLGQQLLKGISKPIHLWRVAAVRSVDSRFEAARSETGFTPLVGREEEIALLLRRWQQAKDGEGQVVLVGGEPGIGKSRLTRVVREQLGRENSNVIRYQCSPYHINSALYPITDQLGRAARFSGEDSVEQRLDKLAVLGSGAEQGELRLLAALLSLPTDRYGAIGLSPQKQKEVTLELLVRRIESLALAQPLLLIFEDAHWSDATSQEFLDLLVPRLRDVPLLMIITYRPEYVPHWSDQTHVTALGLNRLDRRQARELVTKLADGNSLPADLLNQIVGHTDGVPLFIEEITKSILESTLLRQTSEGYELEAPLSALAIPSTLRDSLVARLDRLAPIREIAQIGACIGREFSYELLAAVVPLSSLDLDQALEQLISTGLVFKRGTPPAAIYTFKHALVQDAAYDSLLKMRRQELHQKIARAIDASRPETKRAAPEILAHHYTVAGQIETAVHLWQSAGQLALGRMALKEAISHLNKGVDLLAQLPDSQQRDETELQLRTTLGTAWLAMKGWPAEEVWTNNYRAFNLAQALQRTEPLVSILWGLFAHVLCRGRAAESLEWVQKARSIAGQTDDSGLLITGHMAAVTAYYWMGEFGKSCAHANSISSVHREAAHRYIATLTNHDPKIQAGVLGANSKWILGFPDQAVNTSDLTEAYARRRGHPFALGWALTVGAGFFEYRNQADELLKRVEEAERVGRDSALPFVWACLVPLYRGIALIRKGITKDGISTLKSGIAVWEMSGGKVNSPYLKSVLADGIAQDGDVDSALELIDEQISQAERPGWEERFYFPEMLRLKGWMLSLKGNLEKAQRYFELSKEWASRQHAASWELRAATSLARLWQQQGRALEAYDVLAPIYNWFTEGFDTRDLREAKALLDELRR